MSTTFRSLLTATVLLAGLSHVASAQEMYPRIIGSGETVEIEYGPSPQRNILGGGAVQVQNRGGTEIDVTHLDERFVQRPVDGVVPVLRGQGESRSLAYVPAGGAIGG